MNHLLPALFLVCTSAVVRAADTDWTKTSDLNGIVQSMTQLKAVAAAAPLPAAAAPVTPLTSETIAFLQSIGLDPMSEDVRLAHETGEIETIFQGDPVTNSLESLARAKKKGPVLHFVTTRAFIARLKKDFNGTQVPEKYYSSDFLTQDEKVLVGKKVAQSFLKG